MTFSQQFHQALSELVGRAVMRASLMVGRLPVCDWDDLPADERDGWLGVGWAFVDSPTGRLLAMSVWQTAQQISPLATASESDRLLETVAEAIYRTEGGMSDAAYLQARGRARKTWKTSAEWDTDPNELCEHERDEYRLMAQAALDSISKASS